MMAESSVVTAITIGHREVRTGHAFSDRNSGRPQPVPDGGRGPRPQRHTALRRVAAHVVGHARRAGRPSPRQRGPGRTRRGSIDLPAAVGPRFAGCLWAARGWFATRGPRRRAVPRGYQLGTGV